MQRSLTFDVVVSQPALPSAATPADRYLPGTFRQATDCVHAAVSAFLAHHPEYARLSTDAIEQVLATYRTDEEHETAARLGDEGVPVGRRAAGWSDDV